MPASPLASSKLKVFVSYSRDDIDFADQLVAALETYGVTPTLDRTGIHGAEKWEDRLSQLILEADTVIFILTPDSAISDVCRWEVDEALRHAKRIIPVIWRPLGEAKPHDHLRGLNYIFFYPEPTVPGSGFGRGLGRLADALTTDVSWIREHTRLGELAARWKQDERPALLLHSSELQRLLKWRDERPANAPNLTEQQREFLQASETAETERQSAERKQLEGMRAAQEERETALRSAEAAQIDRQAALKQAQTAQREREQVLRNIVLFVVPTIALALLVLAPFLQFPSIQTTEYATQIFDMEAQCRWELLVGAAAPASVTGNSTCVNFLPKIVFFFVLLMLWCVIANVATMTLLNDVRSPLSRLGSVAIVTLLPSAIIIYNYMSSLSPSGILFQKISLFLVLIILVPSAFLIIFWKMASGRHYFYCSIISSRALLFLAIVIFCVASILFAFHTDNIFNYLGTANIVFLYLLLAYSIVAGLFDIGRTTGIPVVVFLLLWIAILDISDVNQSRAVQNRPVAGAPLRGDQQFLKWLAGRPDRASYQGREYPVYLVAASGGQLYAAMRTAYMLEFLQQTCPGFAHHIFGVSAVSGGGLGALAFAARRTVPGSTGLAACTVPAAGNDGVASYLSNPMLDEFFSRDLISTIVGADLFPSMLQRILPWPVGPLDRARAFHKALRDNWRSAVRLGAVQAPADWQRSASGIDGCRSEDFFGACDINAYWNPSGDVPILAFNATEVVTGAPVILSNLDTQYYANSLAARSSPSFEGHSIYLIESASITDRFPLVLAESFGTKSDMRLVDGGQFDDSGLTMALTWKLALEEIARAQNLPVKVRILYLGETVASVFDVAAGYAGYVGPGARGQRGAETIRQVFRMDPTGLRFQWDPAFSDDSPCEITMDWYLAPCTRHMLKVKLRDAVLNGEAMDTLRQDLLPQ